MPQIISIKNLEDESEVYLRAKLYIYSGTNQMLDMNMIETVNWVYNEEDGYFYFNSLLTPQNKVALCSYVYIDEDTKLHTDTKYIVTFVVESLSTNQIPENIWGNNPIENV